MAVMLDMLGRRINPLLISRFEFYPGHRVNKSHRRQMRLPWYSRGWFYEGQYGQSYWQSAKVSAVAASGDPIFVVEFGSNYQAREFFAEMREQHENCLQQFCCHPMVDIV